MDIATILEQRAFAIVFQPIVRLTDRHILGYEALTRFADGSRPDERFAEAARVGLRPALELTVLRAAAVAARKLPVRAAVFLNISPSVLLSDGASVGDALVNASHHPVALEISEGEAIGDPADLLGALARHSPFARLALDDVGAGHADINRIFALSPAFVKLDRELVIGMAAGGPRRNEAEQILIAAASVRADVIAEGLETEAEVLRLAALGVAYGQGWALGRPADVEAWATAA